MQRRTTQSDSELADYWIEAASRRGRARLGLRLRFKRLAWRLALGLSFGLKRLIDLAAASAALLLLAPVFAVTALLIKLEDGGPVFFRQRRIGFRGEPFDMWKFRSMIPDAERVKERLLERNEHRGAGVTFKMRRDPRLTRVGRVIRKRSIDELPQFWNVLRGEMSIVGPRPPVPSEVDLYTVEERRRLLAKPGLTCFWQVGGRADIDFSDQVALDVEYIRSESLWLDLKLLLKTIPAVLLGKGAY